MKSHRNVWITRSKTLASEIAVKSLVRPHIPHISIGLSTVGFIAGIVVGYLLADSPDDDGPPVASVPRDTAIQAEIRNRPIGSSLPITVRNPQFATASSLMASASSASVQELEAQIREIAETGRSQYRRFALELLLRRLTDVNRWRAFDLARSLDLDSDTVAGVFSRFSRLDPAAATEALRTEADLRMAMAMALGLMESLGGDAHALEEVVKKLPETLDETRFRIEALAHLSAVSPEESIRSAQALDAVSARVQALRRIAEELAGSDPSVGMSLSGAISDSYQRAVYQGRVFSAWARQDPAALLDHLESSPDLNLDRRSVSREIMNDLARIDPARLLRISRGWPRHTREFAESSAIYQWTETDPLAAYAAVNKLPLGRRRDSMLETVAMVFGQTDPDAAIAWAQSIERKPEWMMASIISGIARTDAARAYELAASLEGDEGERAMYSVARQMYSSDTDPRPAVELLMQIQNEATRRQGLEVLLAHWARDDPEGAADWWLANHAEAGARSMNQIARALAETDVEKAASFTNQVPKEHRRQWVEVIAASYADNEPGVALGWIEQLPRDGSYEAALSRFASRLAHHDPTAATAYLDQLSDPAAATSLARAIAHGIGRTDPESAARWAGGLDDERVRSSVYEAVAREWARKDPGAATYWVLALDRGNVRDRALRQVLTFAANTDAFDEGALDAFDSDLVRQQTALEIVLHLSQTNPPYARAILDRYVTEPSLRVRGETELAGAGG